MFLFTPPADSQSQLSSLLSLLSFAATEHQGNSDCVLECCVCLQQPTPSRRRDARAVNPLHIAIAAPGTTLVAALATTLTFEPAAWWLY